MKIAQVCPRYYPYIGGVETVVKMLSERLVQRRIEVEVLSQDPSGQYQASETINGVIVRRFKTGPLGLDLPFVSGTLREYLKENSNKYDILHTHKYHDFPALYAVREKKGGKLVFNAHYHGRGHNFLTSLLLIPYHPIGKVIFEKTNKIVCVSEFEKVLIQSHFSIPTQKLIVIPNGVNIDEIARAKPFPFGGRLILYVGRLEKYKNVHMAIKAMPYLPAEHKLMIIGNGPYKGKLLQLIEKLQLTNRVQILSGLRNEEVYSWYKTCDLALNLSSQEAFGLTVIEGLAAGKPVIVNNKAALAELATKFDGVYAVNAQALSPEQLAKQLAVGYESEVQAADLAEYSWDSIVERTIALYQSL